MASLKTQTEQLIQNEPLRFFEANGAQAKWIAEISRPGAFIVINASGNGAGKTFGIVAVLGAFFWPDLAPDCFRVNTDPGNPFIRFVGPKRARIISTPKELEDIGSLQTAIQQLWPVGLFTSDKKGKSYPSQYTTSTGWVLDLMSYEQQLSEFAGPSLGLVIFNEPMPKPIFDESVARTRKGGLILGAMTSLREHPWVVDGLLSKANGKDIRVVYGDIEDNCKEHGKNGTLEHGQIERILSHYDPDERESRKTGKPLRFSGRIYKTFDRSVHVAKEPIKLPSNGVSLYMAVDPAIGKPFACIWAFVDPAGVVTIYDEYPNFDFEGSKDSNLTVRDYAAIFRRKEQNREVTRIIDRHFANSQRSPGGLTLKQEFADVNIDFYDSYKEAMQEVNEVEAGILAVKGYLRWNQAIPISSTNKPKIVISPTCVNTILSFERWTRDPDSLKPTEPYKDFCDTVRYLLKANPEYESPFTGPKARQPFFGVGQQ